jgi:hypothetical protein
MAKEKLKVWESIFPDAVVTLGNHDLIFERKIKTTGLPSAIMQPYNEIFDVGWRFVDDIEFDGTIYCHGTKISWAKQALFSHQKQKNSVMGHLHSVSSINNISQTLWTARVGCGIDFKLQPFEFLQNSTYTPIISAMVVDNNQPYIYKL